MRRPFPHRGALAFAGVGVVGAAAIVAASACLVSQDGSPYVIDGGGLGSCSGNEAREIPASACPNVTCCGTTAFALCLGTSYSDCSCILLDGFHLVSASGQPVDAASIDLGGECGSSEGDGTEAGPSEGGESAAPREAGSKDARPPDARD